MHLDFNLSTAYRISRTITTCRNEWGNKSGNSAYLQKLTPQKEDKKVGREDLRLFPVYLFGDERQKSGLKEIFLSFFLQEG